MIPRSLRLPRKGFEHMRSFRRTTTTHFSLSYGKPLDTGGLGIIVPKKVVKGAVQRHFIKRRLRAIIRPMSRNDLVIIISARKGAESLTFKDMNDELSPALHAILADTA